MPRRAKAFSWSLRMCAACTSTRAKPRSCDSRRRPCCQEFWFFRSPVWTALWRATAPVASRLAADSRSRVPCARSACSRATDLASPTLAAAAIWLSLRERSVVAKFADVWARASALAWSVVTRFSPALRSTDVRTPRPLRSIASRLAKPTLSVRSWSPYEMRWRLASFWLARWFISTMFCWASAAACCCWNQGYPGGWFASETMTGGIIGGAVALILYIPPFGKNRS